MNGLKGQQKKQTTISPYCQVQRCAPLPGREPSHALARRRGTSRDRQAQVLPLETCAGTEPRLRLQTHVCISPMNGAASCVVQKHEEERVTVGNDNFFPALVRG